MTEYVRKKDTRESIEVAAGQGTSMQVLISSEEAPNFAFRKFVMEPHGGMPKHTNLIEHVSHSYKAGKDGFEFICVVPNKEDKIEILE